MKRLVSVPLAALVVASVACDQQPITESAQMRRPSGLVYVPRTEAGRADVLVVDSESQGVRVRQLARVDETPQPALFVPAPVVFFPLVIPAPGFPTRAAASTDGDRSFVIAPAQVDIVVGEDASAKSILHVLDTRPLPYGGRVSPDDNIRIGGVDLSEAVPGALVPVDVLTLADAPNGDRVAVAFDRVGPGMGKVVVFDVTVDPVAATEVVAIDIPGAVRRMVQRGDKLYVSNALTNVVTEVDLGGATRAIDVGGPTNVLVDAEDLGLLALRVDRSSVVVMLGDPLERSTVVYASPFKPIDERPGAANADPDIPGRIDLHDSPLGAAAYGVIPFLPFGDARLVPEGGGPAVMVVHVDGFATFLNVDTSSGGIALGIIAPAAVTSVWRRDGPSDLTIAECAGLEVPSDTPDTDFECSSVIANDFPSNDRYRVTVRGPLVRERSATLQVSTTTTTATLLSTVDFAARQVRAGDRVVVHAYVPDCGTEPGGLDGVQAAIDEGVILAAVDGGLAVGFDGPLAQVALCDAMAIEADLTVDLFEVYPGEDEAVLSRVASGRIIEIIERSPLAADRMSVSLGRGATVGPLAFTLTSSSPMACTTAVSTEGAPCASDLECAVGWACEDTDLPQEGGVAIDRLGRCALATCPQDRVCLEETLVRACPGLELDVTGTQDASLDLRIVTTDNNASVTSAAPDDAIWAPLNGNFLVSFPGARRLVVVTFGETAIGRTQVR